MSARGWMGRFAPIDAIQSAKLIKGVSVRGVWERGSGLDAEWMNGDEINTRDPNRASPHAGRLSVDGHFSGRLANEIR